VTEAKQYELIIRGHFDPSWSDWFGGADLRVTDDGQTVITPVVCDQAALHGVLGKIRDLGVELVGLRRLDAPWHQRAAFPLDTADTAKIE
jgi:hypothetical protein